MSSADGERFVTAVEARLRELLNECNDNRLCEAMSYSVLAGGKRLRPQLLLAACEAVSGAYPAYALDFACAVEMIHTYSLIHDDLPAMDDDDFRRGKPTSHKVFGEALAILTGDALLHHAFETMARCCFETGLRRSSAALYVVATSAGVNGMVTGQVMDMRYEHKNIDNNTLLYIHERKTGALMASCLEAGALLGGASGAVCRKMVLLGHRLGLAFQIRDDILDVTATSDALGKPVHSDEKNDKSTYVSLHGLKKAQADYQTLSEDALAILKKLPHKTAALESLISFIIHRDY